MSGAWLRAAAAVVGLGLAAPAAAQEPTGTPAGPLSVGGSFWSRYEHRTGYESLGASRGRFVEGDFAVFRARLDLRTRLLELDGGWRAQAVFSPQADGFWGQQPTTVSTANLGIYRGYLSLSRDGLSLDVGRFDMNYGDALVIGDLRWHQTGRSYDGARTRVSGDGWWVDGFFTQLDDGLRNALGETRGNPAFLDGDVFFTGIYASLGGLIGEATTVEPYLLGQIWPKRSSDGARPAIQGTAGLRALQRFGPVDLRLEGGAQFGRRRVELDNPDVLAFAADAEAGLTVARGLRLSLEAAYASGDDPGSGTVEGWDQLYPTGHKWLGLMDIIGPRTNVASGVFHARFGSGPFGLKLDVHSFLRPETADDQDAFAGVESDLQARYRFGDPVLLRAMYALFVPGSAFAGDPDPAHYAELQLSLQY